MAEKTIHTVRGNDPGQIEPPCVREPSCARVRRHFSPHRISLLLSLVFLSSSSALAADVHSILSGRTEARVRSPLSGDRGRIVTTDLELLPDARVTLGWGNTRLAFQYNPSLLLREPQLLGRVYLLHRGRAAFMQHFGRANLLVQQEASAGETDVSALIPTDGTPINNASGVQTSGAIPYRRLSSMIVFDASPTDRTSFNLSGGYLISGSPVVNYSLPLQWGPLASARFRGKLLPRNYLITYAQFMSSTFATGQTQLIASLTESYERQLSREVTISVGAGAALTREHIVALPPIAGPSPIPGDYQEILPVAVATVSWRSRVAHAPMVFNGSARLGPFADRFTGYVYERVETQVGAEWRFERPWTWVGAAGFAYAVPIGLAQQVGDSLYYAESGVRWMTFTWLQLGALGRVVYSEQPRLGAGQLQWLLTLSATVRHERSVAW